MAVNDLMMRIQLLVDSGKSSAELGRVQASLNALTKDLAKLSQIKLNLKDQLAGLTELGSKLKQVNLGNFTTSIGELEKGFGKLNLQTTQLAKWRSGFRSYRSRPAGVLDNRYTF
jgi:flagellar biosynthesis chaperone FliJ